MYSSLTRKQPTASNETSSVARPGKGHIRIALVFPNTYYVGMSNLGFQTLYRIFSLYPDVVCERVFLPENHDLQQITGNNMPLTSYESGQPLGSFHVIAFSISFENDYLNILTILDLGRIPLLQKQRTASHPLIIGGGVSIMLNPEPLAVVFDLFVIGEAEEVLEEFLDILSWQTRRKRWQKTPPTEFAKISGIYVPSGYDVHYTNSGEIKAFSPRTGFPGKIKSRQPKNLNLFPASSCVLTPHTEFSDMLLVEISRGCPRACRFCAAGSVYNPFRVRTVSTILNEINSSLNKQSKIGILGSAVCDHPGLAVLINRITSAGSQIAISSLRADALTEEIIARLKSSKLKTFTIAPEAGSERLRRAINKHMTNEDIFQAIKMFARCHITRIKLYFIIGLPGETEEDIKAIIRLVKELKHVYYKETKGERWLHHITLSISPFVPKPWTPLQWHPFEQVSSLKRKIKTISNGLKKEKKISVNYDLPKWGYVQTLLSRGDRNVSDLLISVFKKKGHWNQVLKESSINADFYVYRDRTFEEILPWDFIDHGIDKIWLWEEYQKALA